jgi:hypothetical protein
MTTAMPDDENLQLLQSGGYSPKLSATGCQQSIGGASACGIIFPGRNFM